MQTVIKSSTLSVTILHKGAELCSIKDNSQNEFIWQAGEEWKRHAPVLFPIVGELKNGNFCYQGKSFVMGRHGFARDSDFEVVEVTPYSCKLEMQSNNLTKAIYPFDFIFQISFTLYENRLEINHTVTNPSSQTFYFSLGAHPAFNCNINNKTLNDFYLDFEKKEYSLTTLKDGLRLNEKSKLSLTDNKLPLSAALFDNDALVFEDSQINNISLCSNCGKYKITLHCFNWPYFGIWTRKDCDKFICLEPWYGVADSETAVGELKTKEGIMVVSPYNSLAMAYSIIIH